MRNVAVMNYLALALFIAVGCQFVAAQTTAFSYQGKLSNNGSPVSANYDFEFRLYDLLSGGAQQGATQTLTNVAVTNGVFAVQLDFGPLLGVEEHPVAGDDRPDVRPDPHRLGPGEPPADRRGGRDQDAGARFPLAVGGLQANEDAVVQEADRQRFIGAHAGNQIGRAHV